MQVRICYALLAAAFTLSSCEFLPGTEAYRIARAKRAVAKLLIDPEAVQFRNTSARGDYLCGELNGRNRMGAFVGFKRFVVKLDGTEPLIDPEFDFAELIQAEESCQSLAGNSYASLSTRLSVCERADEQRAAQTLQAAFDSRWQSRCSFARSQKVYRPPLADALNGNSSPTELPEQQARPSEAPADPLVDENASPIVADESGQQSVAPEETGNPTQEELDQAFPSQNNAGR